MSDALNPTTLSIDTILDGDELEDAAERFTVEESG